MDRRILMAVGAGILLVAGGWVVLDRYFLPAGTVVLDQDAPEGAAHAVGMLQGRDGHSASGSVALVEGEDGWWLHFTDLQVTDGPDIYLYATPAGDPTISAQIAAGWRVPVVTPQDESARINERGTFSVPLPPQVDVGSVGGIGIWCERFSVPFASAELVPAASA